MSKGGGAKATYYQYNIGMHLVLCRGPIDSLDSISMAEKVAWTGPATASTTISINQPDLFGGIEREGGLVGTVDILMGEATQGVNTYLQALHAGQPMPFFRGMVGLVLRKVYAAANSPYIKPVAARGGRYLKGWQNDAPWYAAKAKVALSEGRFGMNPAHIIYQCLTDRDWGMGYSAGAIDDASFRAAADVFYGEGMGLCLKWTREEIIERFIQVIMDHISAALGQDRITGLFTLRPLRFDYNPALLPVFSEGEITELVSYQRTSLSETINELKVTYVSAIDGNDAITPPVQNLANIQSQGGVVSQTKSYPGFSTGDLALRAAMRDLLVVSSPLAKVKFTANRAAYSLISGSVFKFTWPKLGIVDMVMRVLTIDYGTLFSGKITIEATEDVFTMPSTVYAAQQPSLWSAPSTAPAAVPLQSAFEASYYDLVRAEGMANAAAMAATAGFVAVTATAPTGLSLRFDIWTKTGAAAYALANSGDWTPTGTLTGALSLTATSIVLASPNHLDRVAVGSVAMIGAGAACELVRVDAVNVATSTLTIARGCVDTLPAAWAAATRVWLYDGWFGFDDEEYATGEVVSAKLLPVTTSGTLAIAAATALSVTMSGRQARPYPPALVKINSVSYPTAVTGATPTLSWAQRNRIVQADQVLAFNEATVAAEAGQTYTMKLYKGTLATLLETQTGLAGTSCVLHPTLADTYIVQLWSVRAGLVSMQTFQHSFTWS